MVCSSGIDTERPVTASTSNRSLSNQSGPPLTRISKSVHANISGDGARGEYAAVTRDLSV